KVGRRGPQLLGSTAGGKDGRDPEQDESRLDRASAGGDVRRPVRRVLRAAARVDAPRRGRTSEGRVPDVGRGATGSTRGADGGAGGPRAVLFFGLRQLPQRPRDAGERGVRPGSDSF